MRDALAGTSVEPETVVDLGCGWGAALGTIAATFPDAAVLGGNPLHPLTLLRWRIP